MNRLTDKIKNQIIQLYVEQKLSVQKIFKRVNIPRRVVNEFLRQSGILRKVGEVQIIPCDSTYFSNIDTEEKAYWLGYLFADGNVNSELNKIVLSSIDYDTMCKFKEAVKYQGNIRIETHKIYKKQIYKIQITNKPMCSDLCKLGCIPNKSLIMNFPTITKSLIPHFIRGYFDGDGTVGVYKNSLKKENCFTLRSGFCSGSKIFIDKLVTYLPVNKKTVKKDNANLFLIDFSVSDSLKLYDFMYTNATVFLPRKKEKFDLYRERRSTTIIGRPEKDEGIV